MSTTPITSDAVEVEGAELSDNAIAALAVLLVDVATKDTEEAQE